MLRNQQNCQKDYIPFKILFDAQQRKQKYKNALKRSDQSRDMVFLILQPHPKTGYKQILINNCKFSCQSSHTISYIKQQLLIRYKKENPTKNVRNISLFLYCNNTILMGDRTIGSIRDQHQDSDGFVYIKYAQMDVYG